MSNNRPLFSRPVPAHDLPLRGRSFQIEANPQERAALAHLFGIPAIDRLSADGSIRPQAGGRRVKVEGRLQARVVQNCVITLEPVAAEIDAPFERLYGFDVPEEWADETSGEVWVDLAGDLPVEPLPGGLLDLGATLTEQLSLELDPYPRAEGAVFKGLPEDDTLVADDEGGRRADVFIGRLRKNAN